MKNIHILPTDKPSVLIKDFNNKFLLTNGDIQSLRDGYQFKHIYITSDKEIKEGDWFYNIISLKPEPFKACENGNEYVNCNKYSHYRIDCKKIILTTDQDLIKDSVQAIDDEFLEWFVKNPSCEEVEVAKGKMKLNDDGQEYGFPDMSLYKIIIPQEEPKQETLEEAIKREYETRKFNSDFPFDPQSFKLGAKWQAERMYSVEEVLEILENHTEYLKTFIFQYIDREDIEENKTWFEQFKKK
jgi:hypothetical protein